MMAIKNGLIPDRQHNLKFFLAQTARYLHFWLCYIWLIHHPPPINKGTLIAKQVCPFHLLDICLSNFVNLRTTVWHNIFFTSATTDHYTWRTYRENSLAVLYV